MVRAALVCVRDLITTILDRIRMLQGLALVQLSM